MPLLMPLSMAGEWSSLPQGSGASAGINGEQDDGSLNSGFGRIHTSTLERPPLRSHKSFPYALGTSSYASPHTQSPLSQVAAPHAVEEMPMPLGADLKAKDEHPLEISVQMSYGGSAPVSPVPQLTPTSVEDENKEFVEMGEEEELAEEDEHTKSDTPREKTAAERRAEKRKMKRFRLTHNQTRFLMSEFARQAHPDAAQRERLSREIPGLSPRQVQVWFQNRRAKLKRLTIDDRERIMKSRALPEDFDMAQALHSPFGASSAHPFTSQPQSTPLVSPAAYPSYEGGMLRPLNVTGLRRESEDDSTISPISISSNFGPFFTPPASVTNSETLSPVSPTNDRAPFSGPSYVQPSPRSATFWGNRSSSFSNYQAPQNAPRLQMLDRLGRSRAESLASPLRTSMSYTGNLDHATTTTEPSISQPLSAPHPNREYWSESVPAAPGSSGFHPPGFQSSALARHRPITTTFPPGLNLQPQTRPILPFGSLGQSQELQGSRAHSSMQPTYHSLSPTSNAHSNQPPHASGHSMFYGAGAQAQLPDIGTSGNQSNLYGVQYPDPDNEPINTYNTGGVSGEQAANAALEPESYYKSEPYAGRHSTLSDNLGYGNRPHSSSFGSANLQQSPSLLSGPAHMSSAGPFSAGLKRRRDSIEPGSDPDQPSGDFEGGSRKRSYTMPSGYRSGGMGS